MSYIPLIPRDAHAEKAVIEAALSGGESITAIMEHCSVEDFHCPAEKAAFTLLRGMFQRGLSLEQESFTGELNRLIESKDPNHKDTGGVPAQSLAGVFSASFIADVSIGIHIERIKEARRLRAVHRMALDALSGIGNGSDSKALISSADKAILEVYGHSTAQTIKTARQVANEAITKIEEASKLDGKLKGVPTGLSALDYFTSGYQQDQLIVIAARPGVGKSVMGLQGAIAIAESGNPVGIFTLEMSAADHMLRAFSSRSSINLRQLMSGSGLSAYNMDSLGVACEDLARLPIFFDDASSLNLAEFRAKARRMVLKHGVRALIVDYLQLMEGSGESANRVEEVTEITRTLKQIARDLKVPVIVLAQLNRKPDGGRAELHHLRESGCISANSIIYGPNHRTRIDKMMLDADGKDVYSARMTKTQISKVKKAWKTGIKNVFEMTLSTGHKITATGNHKFLSGSDRWIPMEELSVGDLVAIPLNAPLPSKATISKAEARLMGLFISNGCTLPHHVFQITLNALDMDLVEKSFADIHSVFPGKMRPHWRLQEFRGGASKAINCFFPSIAVPSKKNRSPLSEWFRLHDMWNRRAKEKKVPSCIFNQPKEIIAEFLAALFAGDGTCGIGTQTKNGRSKRKFSVASYSSCSRQLVDDVQWLLQCLGIISGISKVECRGFVSYTLSVYSKCSKKKFSEIVGFLSDRKMATMNNVIQEMDKCPVVFEKYVPIGDLALIPIKSITAKQQEEVWDMEVPENKNFVANGILVHNSTEQDSDIVMLLNRKGDRTPLQIDKGEYPTILDIAKNRNGPTVEIELVLQGKYVRFVEAPRDIK